ncbi:MAG: DUF1549 and DUF1553 domain-containing protein [Planctomycetota bacterium]|nr:DUF1549 and DUF1553 domain-containing protein [Planctomycetota bacterium]
MAKQLPRVLIAGFVMLAASVAVGQDSDEAIIAKINQLIQRGWEDNEVKPSEPASDGEWARRVSLDVLGHIPSYDNLMGFIESDSPNKRSDFIEQMLEDTGYIRNWTNVWGNVLVGRGGNRGNRPALDRWLRRAIAQNMPYNQFVRELITAEGSNGENGAVGFLASHLNDGARPATAITARVFLGLQVQCTECHNHPFNDWKQDQFWSMNGFFRGTQRQRGAQQGEFALYDRPNTDTVLFEKRSGIQQATQRKFVDGSIAPLNDRAKPRFQLAAFVTDPKQPYMTRAIVNRLWGHFFGYGFTKPVDDMGPHNPPSHPELLEYLSKQFQDAGHDTKRLVRWIASCEAYALSSRFGTDNEVDDPAAGNTALFSHMYLKNFTAEQLYDSLIVATQAHKANRNNDAAENQRRNWLQQFVQTFGTDENDEMTTFNGTIPQAFVLMNGALMQSAVSGAKGAFLQRVLDSPTGDIREPETTKGSRTSKTRPKPTRRPSTRKTAAGDKGAVVKRIETLFLVSLARKPTESELEAFNAVFQESGTGDPIQGLQDVFWALLNSNEFIINH